MARRKRNQELMFLEILLDETERQRLLLREILEKVEELRSKLEDPYSDLTRYR